MTSSEVSEWYAYYNIKEKRAAIAQDEAKKAAQAKQRAKDQNY